MKVLLLVQLFVVILLSDKGLHIAEAKIWRVKPGESIQAAIDDAQPGDRVMVEPGIYQSSPDATYGLRIIKDNIKIHASWAPYGNVRLVAFNSNQKVGVYAAPASCDYTDDECDETLHDFEIKGLTVQGFDVQGILARFVDGFKILKCTTLDNGKAISAMLSSNGLVRSCNTTRSSSCIWVAGSINVDVLDNDISNCVTGLEVTLSKNIYVAKNVIHDNVIGIGLYHPSLARAPEVFDSSDNWTFENNHIYDNNLPNQSPSETFNAALPPGIGVLVAGASGHTIRNNQIENHNFVGIAVVGYCVILGLGFGRTCENDPPENGDPSSNFNTVISNVFDNNGAAPVLGLPGVDILYYQMEEELGLLGEQNCFTDNTSRTLASVTTYAFNGVEEIPLPSICNV